MQGVKDHCAGTSLKLNRPHPIGQHHQQAGRQKRSNSPAIALCPEPKDCWQRLQLPTTTGLQHILARTQNAA
jgi:hypothetical protein